jgi:glycosyltransferase involved in cell wall biosynthesis
VIRVCHLVTALGYGGVERQMRVIAESTLDRRGTLHFVAIASGGMTRDAIAQTGHHVTCLQSAPSAYSATTFLAVLRAIGRLRPDVVHTHGAEANFHGLPAAFLVRVPVRIGEEIGLPSHSRLARFAFRQVYRFAHRVIAVSSLVADDLVRTGEVAREDIAVIEYPVRPLASTAPGGRTPRARPLCGFVGRLVHSKNVVAVLDALQALAAHGRPFDFQVIGDGPERSALDEATRARGLGAYVTFLGYQDRPEDSVRNWDVFVMPSAHEGYCIALIEAMAMGVPAISTMVGIAPEVIQEGESGWLVPVGDTQALTEKLDQVLSLPGAARHAIGTAGQREVVERNSPARYVARLDALYTAVRAGGHARARP